MDCLVCFKSCVFVYSLLCWACGVFCLTVLGAALCVSLVFAVSGSLIMLETDFPAVPSSCALCNNDTVPYRFRCGVCVQTVSHITMRKSYQPLNALTKLVPFLLGDHSHFVFGDVLFLVYEYVTCVFSWDVFILDKLVALRLILWC